MRRAHQVATLLTEDFNRGLYPEQESTDLENTQYPPMASTENPEADVASPK